MKKYDHGKIEKKWQKDWAKKGLYKTRDAVPGKKNAFLLTEFPYPSGNLHVGHWYAFAVPDIAARAMRMQGKNVLYPVGFDAFGLPAENAAIKRGLDPRKWTLSNIAYMKKQMASMGTSFDWSREVQTIDPDYYRWTQWMFTQFLKSGLAYRKETPVNWCPKDKTVLANEQVVGGLCERCDTPVEQRNMLQWNLRITDYADRLVDDLDALDWPQQIKDSQKNWIGRSEGAEIDFPLALPGDTIKRFVILHGKGADSTKEFLPWAKAELEKRGYEVQVPDLPNTTAPDDEEQAESAAKQCTFDEHTAVIGKSFGGIVALRLLESGVRMGRLTLVGTPFSGKFLDGRRRPTVEAACAKGFVAEAINRNCGSITLIYDEKDHVVPVSDGESFQKLLGAHLMKRIARQSHFNADTEPDVLMAATPTVRVFTTRPDTLFGATYVVLAPEHEWVRLALGHKTVLGNSDEVQAYVEATKRKSDLERQESKEKTGVKLQGVEAINPATGEKIPVYIADYVLAHYGTGAVMAVPAHDERDFEFAQKFGLPIKEVVIEDISKPLPGAEQKDAAMAILRRADGSILVQRNHLHNLNRLPGGGADPGETWEEAVRREIIEETGYTDFRIREKVGSVLTTFLLPVTGAKRIRRAHVFVVELLSDTQIAPDAGEGEEGITHEWVSSTEALARLEQNPAMGEATLLRRYLSGSGCYGGDGVLVESGEFSGLSNEAAKSMMTAAFGMPKKTYRLRDWIVSRQRYWGVPIPVIHCPECGAVPVPDKDLPVKLPPIKDYLPTGDGKSPLAKAEKWKQVECPNCVEKMKGTKHIIFDFDGVIGDTREQNILARIAMGEAKDYAESEAKMLGYFSTKPWHSRGDHFTAEHRQGHDDWAYRYAVEVMKMKKYKLFDGFVKEIRKIPNAKVAVVSAGHEMYSKHRMKESGIRYTHFLAGNHDHSKENKIERVAKDWKVDVKDIYYITDSLADVYELEDILDKRKIIGCAWGYLGAERLRAGLPENQILKSFKEIHSVWKPTIAERETDTLDTFVDSSWYFLRYADPKNKKIFADKAKQKAWMPVDLYSGGAEHTTMHLLYSRFWHKALYDLKLVTDPEPYARRMNRGLIMGPDGQKMSKSRGNVIDPDEIVKRLGADTVRLYLAFIGPFNETGSYPWNPDGVVGVRRFLERIWKLGQPESEKGTPAVYKELESSLHKTIKKVTEDMAALKFNTAIASLMSFLNEAERDGISHKQFDTFLMLLAPLAPHMAEELWHLRGHKRSIHLEKWPKYDAKKAVSTVVTIAVQFNGKVRGTVSAQAGAQEADVLTIVRGHEPLAKHFEGKEPRRIILVPDRLINIVL